MNTFPVTDYTEVFRDFFFVFSVNSLKSDPHRILAYVHIMQSFLYIYSNSTIPPAPSLELGVILRLKRTAASIYVTFCGGKSQKYLAQIFHVECCFKLANSEYSGDGKV